MGWSSEMHKMNTDVNAPPESGSERRISFLVSWRARNSNSKTSVASGHALLYYVQGSLHSVNRANCIERSGK